MLNVFFIELNHVVRYFPSIIQHPPPTAGNSHGKGAGFGEAESTMLDAAQKPTHAALIRTFLSHRNIAI